jgi:hypothetical protein
MLFYYNSANEKKALKILEQKTSELALVNEIEKKIKTHLSSSNNPSTLEFINRTNKRDFKKILTETAEKYLIPSDKLSMTCLDSSSAAYSIEIITKDLDKGLAYFMEIEKISALNAQTMKISKTLFNNDTLLNIKADFKVN